MAAYKEGKNMPKEETLEEEIKEENLEEEEDLEALESDEGEKEDKGEVDDEKKVDDKPEEPPKFTLSDTEEIPSEDKSEDEKIEIVHNGQVYKLTKDKIVELAQKGFDYDFKVGPHGKLAQMIEADPNLSQIVNDYWQGQVSGSPEKQFKVKPIADYEDETAWLQDNLQNAVEGMKQAIPAPQPQRQDLGANVADALKMRDPAHYQTVLPKLAEYAYQLSVGDYQRIDSDMGALCQFYDFVKERELGKSNKDKEVKVPGLRIKSGGGEPPRSDDISPAWKMSKEDFQRQLDKIKGYS